MWLGELLHVAARDGDRGNPRPVRYALLAESSPFAPFFSMDPTSGRARISKVPMSIWKVESEHLNLKVWKVEFEKWIRKCDNWKIEIPAIFHYVKLSSKIREF